MINEILEVIRQRRSIRFYDSRQVTEEALSAILETALFAPTAMNQQKWHFSIVQSKSVLAKMDRIVKENKQGSKISYFVKNIEEKDYHSYYQAPTVVVISGEKKARFVEIDCGAAAQNMTLAAESFGIGSCIMTSSEFLFHSMEGQAMKKILGIPEGYEHVCCVTLGYKRSEKIAAPPRNREVFSYIR